MKVEKAHLSFRSLERKTQIGSLETLSSIGDTECDGQRELKALGQIRNKGNVHHQADVKQKFMSINLAFPLHTIPASPKRLL